MNRRSFLSLLGMSVGGLALEQAIPFNRVWSFPKKIVIPSTEELTFRDEMFLYLELMQSYRRAIQAAMAIPPISLGRQLSS
jgi:hypothetical protein